MSDSGVKNLGDADSARFTVTWLVDGKEVDAYAATPGVPATSTVMGGNSQFACRFGSPGKHSVTFIVDVDNVVTESNERNNSTSTTVR
jgi:subtilase family serine protease